ncbi:MAG: uroporphyrinogen-III C-methyltransferase [Gammaproteobacteria bacterium]|nr:uroporphyrinogen-III C-methyltransferase [Gammaproteobacteria bacterium]
MSRKKQTTTPATNIDINSGITADDTTDQNQSAEIEAITEAVVSNKKPDEKSTQGNSLATLIALLALLIAFVAAGGTVWLWQQLQQSKQAFEQAVNTQNQSSQAQLDTRISAINDEFTIKLSENNKQLNTLATTVDTATSSTEHLAETLATLHSKLNINPKTGWLIAEAKYLLSIANQQLQLGGNVSGSIVALRNADQRLRESGDPTLLNVRSIIADEITQLQSVQVIDVAGAALTLASMQSRVDELSLAGQSESITKITTTKIISPLGQEAEESTAGWRNGLNTVWQAIKQLVVIRERGSDASNPLLTPDQRALIYQNLRLKLESARLSLVQGDEATYKQSLEIAHDWLLEYFDNNAQRNAVKDTLNELGQIELTAIIPDISASLDALRTWQQQQNNSAE